MSVKYKDAKDLLDKGFSVFPVNLSWSEKDKKFQKKPAVAWKAYQDKLPTDKELHEWFDKSKYNGIGLATGKISGVVVVDVEKDGLKDAGDIKSEMVSNTISGGKHYFYEAPKKKTGNTVRIGGKKMDFRGDGGFVVVPPSVGVKEGKDHAYSWEKQCPRFMLSPLPTLTKNNDWNEVKEPLKLSEHTNVDAGSRNDSLYKAACSLVAKHGAQEAWELVLAMNKTYTPPLSDHEVRTLFTSAESFVSKSNGDVKTDEKLLVGNPVRWSNIKEDADGRKWLWENFIPEGGKVLFSALAKAGKTTLLRSLFVAMKNEEEFAGQPTKKCNVLVLSEESSFEWANSREDTSDKDIHNVFIWPRPIRGIPSKSEWVDIIKEVAVKCKELKIDLVVIDTISTFWPVDNENDAAVVKRALVPLLLLTEDCGVAVMIVHHFKKSGGDQGRASRGSGALTGDVDVILEFRRAEDGYPNQRRIKTMGRGIQETELIIELNDGKYETKGEPWIVSKKARLKKILSLFEAAGRPLSSKEVASLWTTTVTGGDSRTIRRYVKELLVSGLLKLDSKLTVQGKIVPVYAPTGWKDSSLDNKKTLRDVPPVQGKAVLASVQGEGQISLASLDRTGTSPIRDKKRPSKNYKSKKEKVYYE